MVAVEVSKQSAENDDITKDDPSNLLGIDASGLTQSEREGLRQVTIALEEFVQGSTIGEFRARLDLLWQGRISFFTLLFPQFRWHTVYCPWSSALRP